MARPHQNCLKELVKNIYEQNELSRETTIRKFRIVQIEGKREVVRNVDFYHLDAIQRKGNHKTGQNPC